MKPRTTLVSLKVALGPITLNSGTYPYNLLNLIIIYNIHFIAKAMQEVDHLFHFWVYIGEVVNDGD